MKKFSEVYGNANSVTLNVTNNCNLNCVYCFEKEKSPAMMPPEIAIDAIDKMYNKLEGREPFTINFFGGEPLLNWKTVKAVIDHCNEKKYVVRYGITTNLTILTDEMLDYFDDVNMPLLVSIDGIKEVHDRNRCNSYDRVIANFKKLIDRGLGQYIETRFTIMPHDIKYTLQGMKELFELGINNFCPMPVTDAEWDDESLEECRKFYKECNEWFLSIVSDPKNKRNVSIKNIDDLLRNVLMPEQNDPYMCPIFGNGWCTIDWKGKVYACHQGPTSEMPFKEDLCIGDLDMVDEKKIKTIMPKADYPKERCKNCIGKSICKCGCPVENMRETGSYTTATKAYCDLKCIMVEASRETQKELLKLEVSHNRALTQVKESMKVKEYVDKLFKETDLSIDNNLQLITQITHLNEMIDNLGGEHYLIPGFRDYINDKLKRFLVALATHDHAYIHNEYREVKD